MSDEFLEFNHWRTGEKTKYPLSKSHPHEEETNLLCPFDDAPLIFYYNSISKGYMCPNCRLDYQIQHKNQEEVNNYFQKHIIKIKKELIDLEERGEDIVLILERAESRLLNKANLSAQDSEKATPNYRWDMNPVKKARKRAF